MGWPLSGNWDRATSGGASTADIAEIMAALCRAVNERRYRFLDGYGGRASTLIDWPVNDALSTTMQHPSASDFSGNINGPLVKEILTMLHTNIASMSARFYNTIGATPSASTNWSSSALWSAAGSGLRAFDTTAPATQADNWLLLKNALDRLTKVYQPFPSGSAYSRNATVLKGVTEDYPGTCDDSTATVGDVLAYSYDDSFTGSPGAPVYGGSMGCNFTLTTSASATKTFDLSNFEGSLLKSFYSGIGSYDPGDVWETGLPLPFAAFESWADGAYTPAWLLNGDLSFSISAAGNSDTIVCGEYSLVKINVAGGLGGVVTASIASADELDIDSSAGPGGDREAICEVGVIASRSAPGIYPYKMLGFNMPVINIIMDLSSVLTDQS